MGGAILEDKCTTVGVRQDVGEHVHGSSDIVAANRLARRDHHPRDDQVCQLRVGKVLVGCLVLGLVRHQLEDPMDLHKGVCEHR